MENNTNSRRHDSDEIRPAQSPLYVGPGVIIEGTIRYESDDPESRLVILGQVNGDIYTNGILQIAQGAIVRPVSRIDCAEIVVAGRLEGDNVRVSTTLLVLQPTANVRVENLCLPPGGLEQSRGSVLNATLDMSDEHQFTPSNNAAVPAPVVPSAAVVNVNFAQTSSGTKAYAGVALPEDANEISDSVVALEVVGASEANA